MRAPLTLAALATLVGCEPAPAPASDGGSTTDGACAESGTFIALQPSFADFTGWTRFDLGPDGGLGDVGDRVVYLNRLPPHRAHAYPVGTILVKTAGWGTADAGPTFAMVKRGSQGGSGAPCYNAAGAAGWEWFELQPQASGAVEISWRGLAPPAGDVYGGVPGMSCNACHAGAARNDDVPSAPLDLGNF